CGQALVDARLLLEDRLELRGTLREYLLAAPIDASGWEQITRATVSLLGRVWDRHALALEWELVERDAHYPGEPDDFQRSAIFRATYTFVWDERLGAISLGH
ncbi:MAG TPA: hypothetical protein VMB50_09810, partial [Myxococcales bacterium]|nr:hypothetical protein [Myxococcales bacterium]